MSRDVCPGVSVVRRFLIVLVVIAAILQWIVVLERVYAAVWAWYKYAGYGGGGHIVVGFPAQAVLFSGAGGLAVLGYFLSNIEGARGSKAWRVVARFGWLAITVCTALWAALLASPLVAIHPR
jgi:hypothetical protein